jgi:Chaperone of endosialidase
VGYRAGFNLTTGNNNIDIGNVGLAAESNTIRLGTQGTQKATYIAVISGIGVAGSAVVVSSAGKLGIVVSSARYKRDIHDMGPTSSGLLKLRPVTFRYKNDPDGIRQYGLVAEEVARIYPELVSRGADGRIETVNYLTLISMLLNELKKQAAENQRQTAENQRRAAENQRQTNEITKLSALVAGVRADRKRERAQWASIEERLSALERMIAVQSRGPRLAAAFNR